MRGVRERLGVEVVKHLTLNQRTLHDKFIAWRSKHVAHSVNAFEDNQVVGYYNSDTVAMTGIQSISVQQHRLVGLGTEDLADIDALAGAILALVRPLIDAQKAHVLAPVRSLPIETVLAGGVKSRGAAGMDDVNRPRRKS